MTKFRKFLASTIAGVAVLGVAQTAQAIDEVNVAFFLEWPTPNQIAKVDKIYDEALGVKVNWTNFGSGVDMAEAQVAGDIDIAYSQGAAPFVNAIRQGKPIRMVGVAVVYEANDCFVRNDLGITSANASELEGKTVAVPFNTMADYAFRAQMTALDVDVSTMTLVDQDPADGAVSLADKSVDMVCLYGADSAAKAGEVGTQIMTAEQKMKADIGSFDVISVTEKFATEHPELVRAFLKVTDEANKNWRGTEEQFRKVAQDAGIDVQIAKDQMATFSFPTAEEQLSTYFVKGGEAEKLAEILGAVFEDSNSSNYAGSFDAVIDGSFLK